MGDKSDRPRIDRDCGCAGESEDLRNQPPEYDKNEEWVQEYIEQFGTEPSFF